MDKCETDETRDFWNRLARLPGFIEDPAELLLPWTRPVL